MSPPKDSLGTIVRDAAAALRARAGAVATAVRPHVTLDNAVKVATVINLLAQAKPNLTPPPPPPSSAKKGEPR